MSDLIDARFLCKNVLPKHLRGAIRMIKHRLALLAENPSAAVARQVFPEKNSWEQAPDKFIEIEPYYARAPWWAPDGEILTDYPGCHQWMEMWTEFCRLFKELTLYVDFQVLWDIFEDTELPEELFSQKLFSEEILNELEPFCIGFCPENGKIHVFRKEARCVGCSKQVCKDCGFCIIDDLGPNANERITDLAIKRVYRPCPSKSCLTRITPNEVTCDLPCECIKTFNARDVGEPDASDYLHCSECLKVAEEQMERKGQESEHNLSCDCGEMVLMEEGGESKLYNGVKVCRLCSRYCTLYEMGDFVGDERVPRQYASMITWMPPPPLPPPRVIDKQE
ncbi:hypothetical protein OCU04_009713 [Sclerotinia nivalis]|uniref:Uncharacterized protein n=1 Tax=Sclerotinia nivalis TaxID=352851 RepID=A0A9X0AFM7_9HELO|nr:hypothetical protein OCU04_009713 [Sclerotinia nivalis]